MKTKTLYDILGVAPTATKKEIQKSYRHLSKTLHPDVNDATDADVKFAEVKEAYELLSDDELRQQYDKQLKSGEDSITNVANFRDIFEQFFSTSRDTTRPVRGEDIEVSLSITAEDILRASPKSLNLKRNKVCGDCKGTGKKESKGRCAHCKGDGGRKKVTTTPFGKIESRETCTHCEGTGKAEFVDCKKCAKKGVIPETEVFEFQLDPTSRFGKTMVFKHKGHAGVDGGETGDLRILLKQSEADRTKVMYETDLHDRRFVPLRTILHGNPYEITFPDGTQQEVTLTSEMNKGNSLLFPEKGLYDDNGNRGFYTLEVVVEFPELTRLQRNNILNVLGDD